MLTALPTGAPTWEKPLGEGTKTARLATRKSARGARGVQLAAHIVERDGTSHLLGGALAEHCNLGMNIGEKRVRLPPSVLHDSLCRIARQPQRHRTGSAQRVGANACQIIATGLEIGDSGAMADCGEDVRGTDVEEVRVHGAQWCGAG